MALQCDVAVKSEVERLMAELSTREGRLDILVNNAGTNYNAKIDQHDFAMFEKVPRTRPAEYCPLHVAVYFCGGSSELNDAE